MQYEITKIANDSKCKAKYDTLSAPLIKISKNLQSKIKQILQDKKDGGKISNLIIGKRFEVRTAYRDDQKNFYNRRLPETPPELAICLLLDQSGSMAYDSRIEVARKVAIIINDFCYGLGIKAMICSHTADTDCEIDVYCDFSKPVKKLYSIMNMKCKYANRDGMALRYCYEAIDKISADNKLVIIVSDGLPNHDGYNLKVALPDIQYSMKKYSKRKIETVAYAIGDDKDRIRAIYGDRMVDITNLESLPLKMASFIRQKIRI